MVRFTMPLKETLAQKMDYIAEYHGRSRIKEIEQAIKEYVAKFEAEVETIATEQPDES